MLGPQSSDIADHLMEGMKIMIMLEMFSILLVVFLRRKRAPAGITASVNLRPSQKKLDQLEAAAVRAPDGAIDLAIKFLERCAVTKKK